MVQDSSTGKCWNDQSRDIPTVPCFIPTLMRSRPTELCWHNTRQYITLMLLPINTYCWRGTETWWNNLSSTHTHTHTHTHSHPPFSIYIHFAVPLTLLLGLHLSLCALLTERDGLWVGLRMGLDVALGLGLCTGLNTVWLQTGTRRVALLYGTVVVLIPALGEYKFINKSFRGLFLQARGKSGPRSKPAIYGTWNECG